ILDRLRDLQQLQEELAQAVAALDAARAEAEAQAVPTQRVIALFQQGGAAQKGVDEAKARLDEARARGGARGAEGKKFEERGGAGEAQLNQFEGRVAAEGRELDRAGVTKAPPGPQPKKPNPPPPKSPDGKNPEAAPPPKLPTDNDRLEQVRHKVERAEAVLEV